MVAEKFDVVVVGAGLAGTAAAYTLAKAGVKTLLVERGDYPGSKNVMGGVIYRQPLEKILPGWWREAPIERPVAEESIWILTEDSAVKVGYRSERFAEEPYNAFTVLRAKFDKWFADKAVEAGAVLVTETVVEDVLRHNGQIVGVRTNRPDGDIAAHVVIAADGVNSLLSQKVGLHGELPPDRVALAVKEIIQLGTQKIDERFTLENGEGATIELFGDATLGMLGYGFIYTNKDTLSVGLGVLLSQLIARKVTPNYLLERFKAHPMVRRLLADGEQKEYMAHLIPEGGWPQIPPLYAPGYLVVGDAAGMVNGAFREGSNYAAISGKLAALTAIEALERGDFGRAMMARYVERLQESFIADDLAGYSRLSRFAHQNPHLLTAYPRLLCDAAHALLTVDGTPKRLKFAEIVRKALRQRPPLALARDVAGALRARP
ncbi:MAG TPA: FAD-dependent oxidoreductase [Chloroflexota bacterium]|nr:FAD-dependent oxidoreductase [Chloroflexota bacterium]